MEDLQELSMKCSSLNHFHAINSASHLCLDKVMIIIVSKNALKTQVLWEVASCQGSLAQRHIIISQKTSNLQQKDCDTLKSCIKSCIHLLPLMISNSVFPPLKIMKKSTQNYIN
jgi:hypothetical protein